MAETEIVQKIVEQFRKIDDLIQEMGVKVDALSRNQPVILMWLVVKLVEAWNAAMPHVQAFWDKVKPDLVSFGDPAALKRIGSQWSTAVGGPVGATKNSVSLALLATDDSWSGQAGNAYRDRAGLQSPAVDAIPRTYTDTLDRALQSLSTAIYVFWAALAAAAVAAVAGILVASGALATLIGAPAAPAALIGALAACVAALVVAAVNFEVVANAASTDLQRAHSNLNAMEAGHWPRIVRA